MKKEDFVTSWALRYQIARLEAYVNTLSWPDEKIVIEYVKKNLPNHQHALRYEVDFRWEANGIVVTAIYESATWGIPDEEMTEKEETFRLTYKEVFGWDIENWKKPTHTKSEANQLVFDVLTNLPIPR